MDFSALASERFSRRQKFAIIWIMIVTALPMRVEFAGRLAATNVHSEHSNATATDSRFAGTLIMILAANGLELRNADLDLAVRMDSASDLIFPTEKNIFLGRCLKCHLL